MLLVRVGFEVVVLWWLAWVVVGYVECVCEVQCVVVRWFACEVILLVWVVVAGWFVVFD